LCEVTAIPPDALPREWIIRWMALADELVRDDHVEVAPDAVAMRVRTRRAGRVLALGRELDPSLPTRLPARRAVRPRR
jgi:hypothetical protein